MRKIIITCVLLATTASFLLARNPDANFDNDLRTAKLLAKREGKFILVDFHASWCTPCKIMQEYTFGNPQVQNYLRQNYITVSVDIDNLDGFALKKEFAVKLLPTVLLLNPSGKMVKKYEETLGAAKMLNILEAYGNSKAREKINAAVPALIAAPKLNKPTPPATMSATVNNNNRNTNANTNNAIAKPTAKIAINEVAAPTKSTVSEVKPIRNPNNGNYTNRYLVAKGVESLPASGFTIQISSGSNIAWVEDFINKTVETKFKGQDVYVHEIVTKKGMSTFKVCVGKLINYTQAQKLKQTLINQGMRDCFIRRFSDLK